MSKKAILFFIILHFSLNVLADGTLMSWGMNDLKGMTKERFEDAKKWTAAEIIQKNLDVHTWPEAYLIAVAANSKKDSIIDNLINQLGNATSYKLELTSRLIIWERILLGDILFEGKGFQTNDDLFSVAGRANWVLRNITKKTFGFVKPATTSEDLADLKAKWHQWRENKTVSEYIDPYDSKEKGLDETHSIVAFEALIYSLKPSEQKDLLIKDCLNRIYHLDEMPKEKNSPALYCNPDTYTLFYLGALIGQKNTDDSMNYNTWKKWWLDNSKKLSWNAAKGIFEVSPSG